MTGNCEIIARNAKPNVTGNSRGPRWPTAVRDDNPDRGNFVGKE